KDSSRKIKLLIVDDRETNRDILVRMLSKIGFVTKECDNGASAIECAAKWKPDIILLDLIMPEMDGKEVIKRLRQEPNGSDYKIIVLTASALEEDKKSVIKLGADTFLRKPFRQNDILEEIKKLTNIEYLFENNQNSENTPIITNEYLKKEMSELTEDILKSIKNNILIGDIAELKRISNSLDQSKLSLSKHLASLIEEYEFERITKIIDSILEE
ncbi:MAG TPA: response regulator, partial [Spirochaetota bacterium]|nr:response regulator [Spirochaetota bacterium]